MALSWSEEVVPAGTSLIPVNIEYLDKSYIHVYIDNVLLDSGNYSWNSDVLIQLNQPLSATSTVLLVRRTDKTQLYIMFAEGAAFIKESLDTQNKQFLHLAQELVEGRSIDGFYGDISMNGYRITNLGDGVNPGDAVNKKQLDEVDQRVANIEGSFVTSTTSYPFFELVETTKDTFSPPFVFDKAAVYINGLCQVPGYSYVVVDNQILLAEPVPAGTEFLARLGEDVTDEDGYATVQQLLNLADLFKDDADRAEAAADRADVSAEQVADAVALRSDLADAGGAGIIGGLIKPITWGGFAGGADSTGVADSAAAFNAVYSAAASGVGIFIPGGMYKEGSASKKVGSDSIWLSRDFGLGVGLATETRKTPLLITIGNPDEPVLSSEHTRTGINITAVGRGGQHIDCIRATTINGSTDGNGNTAIYAAALSLPGALWTAALHGEVKHQGSSTIAVSAEAASYSNTGTFYGMVLNNTTSTAAGTHPSTGAPATLHPSATALYITGSTERGEMGQWIRGIRFSPLSMRSTGTLVRDESACAQGWWSQPSSSKTNADILLEGTAPVGAIFQGSYATGNAIRMASGLGIAYEGTGAIKTKYDSSVTRWCIFNGSTEKVGFNTVTPGLYFNGIKVLGVQQPAIANATAGTEAAAINAILSVMRINGTIATA